MLTQHKAAGGVRLSGVTTLRPHLALWRARHNSDPWPVKHFDTSVRWLGAVPVSQKPSVEAFLRAVRRAETIATVRWQKSVWRMALSIRRRTVLGLSVASEALARNAVTPIAWSAIADPCRKTWIDGQRVVRTQGLDLTEALSTDILSHTKRVCGPSHNTRLAPSHVTLRVPKSSLKDDTPGGAG